MSEWMHVTVPTRQLALADAADEVFAGLWVSAMPERSWPLQEWGISLVVTLADHLPPQAARRFEWGTSGDAAGDGSLAFVHWPIADGDLPDWPLARLIAGFVSTAVSSGHVVLLHCQEGRNRSGLIAALAVRELAGVSGADALEAVRSSRSGMLSNRVFAQALAALPAPA